MLNHSAEAKQLKERNMDVRPTKPGDIEGRSKLEEKNECRLTMIEGYLKQTNKMAGIQNTAEDYWKNDTTANILSETRR